MTEKGSSQKEIRRTKKKSALPAGKKMKKASIKKSKSYASKKASLQEEWIELFPQGISVGTTIGRPVLILKDKSGVEVLPVWMHPVDAGVALAGLSHESLGVSPHSVVHAVLDKLDIEVESCTFVDLVGHHQFVQIVFSGDSRLNGLRMRADEAMSFCLQSKAKFYSTRSYMARCRDMDAELSHLEQNIVHGAQTGHALEIEFGTKKHPYMM